MNFYFHRRLSVHSEAVMLRPGRKSLPQIYSDWTNFSSWLWTKRRFKAAAVPQWKEKKKKNYSWFSPDVTAAMLEPLYKETTAMLEPKI